MRAFVVALLGVVMAAPALAQALPPLPELRFAEIVARDKSANDLYKQLARELTAYMIENPKTITRALNLLTVAKALERVADHCTNISEEVFYLVKGEDIRHERALKKPAAV